MARLRCNDLAGLDVTESGIEAASVWGKARSGRR